MDNSNTNYRDKVWHFLDTLEPGVFCTIENICIPENREIFISCIKAYMETTTKPFQGNITFNSDYTKIYKTDEITFKIIKK